MEIILAILLYLNWASPKWAAIIVLASFCVITLVAIAYKREVPCGCFGDLDGETLSFRTIIRNVLLIALAVGTLRLEKQPEWLFIPGMPVLC